MRNISLAVMTGTLPWILLILYAFQIPACSTLQQTVAPLRPKTTIELVWPAPDKCTSKSIFSESLDLKIFGENDLGLYPFIDKNNKSIGTLPKDVDLKKHLEEVEKNVKAALKDDSTKGLSVINWKKWDPLFERNVHDKEVYQNRSVKANATQAERAAAATAFDTAAEKFMKQTLEKVIELRKNQQWGFHRYPTCFDVKYKRPHELGKCDAKEQALNNKLKWLWTASTALYPVVSLEPGKSDEMRKKDLARDSIKEAIRVAHMSTPAIPVYVFIELTKSPNMADITEGDLNATIGEAIALGAAGVLWNPTDAETCAIHQTNVVGIVGKYMLRTLRAAEECSKIMCQSRGRCVRKQPDTDIFLQFTTKTHNITVKDQMLTINGTVGPEEEKFFSDNFMCQCFNGKNDNLCQNEPGSSSITVTWSQILLLPVGLLHLLH